MRIVDVIVLLLLIIALGLGAYVFWLMTPNENVAYQQIQQNLPSSIAGQQEEASGNVVQFYPNMRFRDKNISYRLESTCTQDKWIDIQRAFDVISEKTVLSFYNTKEEPEIKVMCSEIAPKAEERGHFIAGEGGPSEIINTSNYAVIINGKISLYRGERCQEPKIAIHEILHALGFEHYNSTTSILYPITGCQQQIDQEIIDDIDRLYKAKSLPDLTIKGVSANRTGRYLSFEINISNEGLKNSENSELEVYAGNEKVTNFTIGKLDIGTKKTLIVSNAKLPRTFEGLSFAVNSEEGELTLANNRIEMSAVQG